MGLLEARRRPGKSSDGDDNGDKTFDKSSDGGGDDDKSSDGDDNSSDSDGDDDKSSNDDCTHQVISRFTVLPWLSTCFSTSTHLKITIVKTKDCNEDDDDGHGKEDGQGKGFTAGKIPLLGIFII